jgi:hypothetical protein
VELTTRIQEKPEPIEGNPFLAKQHLADELHYVIVLADGEAVAQQSFYKRGARWWVDDLFVTKARRGGEVIRALREATFRAVAEHTDEFKSWIEFVVAEPEKVLNDPIKRELGVKVELVHRMRKVAQYRYDVSALRPQAAAAG